MTTLREALAAGAAALSGVAGGARDARALLAEVIGLPASRLVLEPERKITAEEQARFDAVLARRAAREPVARILARRQFWGRDFRVAHDTLDPRPETECLIAAALELGPQKRVLDLGTGTGIIAVTLLAEWQGATGLATDIDPACLTVARANAARHGIGRRLSTLGSDWFTHVTGRYPLIVSNPPYIAEAEMADLAPEVADHDPRRALTDGADGLTAYRRIAASVAGHLEPGGHLMVEIGPTQARAVLDLFAQAGLQNGQVLPDFDGRDRVVTAQLPP